MTLAETLFSNLTIHIKFCRDIFHDNNWSERKTKTDYTFWHIYDGTIQLEMNNRCFTAAAGDVVLFYPGDTYKASAIASGCHFLVTFFTLETGTHMNLLEDRQLAGVYHSPKVQEINTSFCNDFFHFFPNSLTPSLKQYASFLNFVSDLFSCNNALQTFHREPASVEKMPLHEIMDYMNEHFLDSLSTELLAARMQMSEKYFIQYFHSHVGISPKQYLVDKRMKHALLLLADNSNTLKYTADILGYSDQYAFSKAFRKYYGEAPGFFRKHLNTVMK